MANIEIKSADPRVAAAIAEGVNAVELRAVKAENAKLKAKEGVRVEAGKRRWERTQRRLARKYTIRPVGRVHGAILGAWALIWLTLIGMADYLTAWNRGRA